MPTVADLITDILKREGGFVNDPRDRGGPTKYGITKNTLAAWLGRPVTVDEVRTLDEDTAREIYERNYYIAPRIDTLPDDVQPVVFDCAVNHGARRAVGFVQKVINEAGFGPVDVDGIIGPGTRAAAAKAAEMGPFFCNAIVEERLAFYESLVDSDPSQIRFLNGWRARAESFREPV